MLFGFAAMLGLIVLLLLPGRQLSQRATVNELASARLIAAARLRQFEDERQERFRRYHQAWATARGRTPARGYVVPFVAGARRG